MKDYTFIDGAFNRDTGISTAIIGTDLGVFRGTSRLHEEDEPHVSGYFGCNVAESKAVEKYCNAKYQYYGAQVKALKTFYRQMQDTRTYNEKDFYVKQLKKQIDKLERLQQYWRREGERMECARLTMIKARDESLADFDEKMKKKHEQKES